MSRNSIGFGMGAMMTGIEKQGRQRSSGNNDIHAFGDRRPGWARQRHVWRQAAKQNVHKARRVAQSRAAAAKLPQGMLVSLIRDLVGKFLKPARRKTKP